MAPEVVNGQSHTIAVDYFALGVFTYECMMGYRPFHGRTRREIKDSMFARHIQVTKKNLPSDWSQEAADFVNKLLLRKPGNRLGIQGAESVKNHPWLRYFVWKDLYEKKLMAPYLPDNGDNWDKKYCEQKIKLGVETKERYEIYLKDESMNPSFVKFYYHAEDAEKQGLFIENNHHKEEHEDLNKEYVHHITLSQKKPKSKLQLGKIASSYSKLRQTRKVKTTQNCLTTTFSGQNSKRSVSPIFYR